MIKRLIPIYLIIFAFKALALDPRYPVNDVRVGRLVHDVPYQGKIIHDVCTATLIGPNTLISAGHCFKTGSTNMKLEFQVPASNTDTSINSSLPEHTFLLDQSSILFSETDSRFPDQNKGGGDWAVFKVLPNEVTQTNPGDMWGYYQVSFEKPGQGASIRMRGYGRSTSIPERNNILQEHTGHITGIEISAVPHLFYDDLYATGGNSGSSVVLQENEKIIGIHVSSKTATLIAQNPKFQEAIQSLLSERP